MSTAVAEVPVATPVNYLNAKYGIRSWLLTTDHKRIAPALPGFYHIYVFHWGRGGHIDAFAPDHSRRRSGPARNLQQAIYACMEL